MSDVTKNICDEQIREREHLTVVELTDKELDKVTGAEWGCFFPFSQNQSLALTSLATSNNTSGTF
jgi:hypothetical protein